jgi:hypothetical protein
MITDVRHHQEEKTKNQLIVVRRNTAEMLMKRRKREMRMQVTNREMVLQRMKGEMLMQRHSNLNLLVNPGEGRGQLPGGQMTR